MLRLVPRHPQKIDTARLRSALQSQGYEVDVRTIQRDLERLSRKFPLYCDDRNKPYGWSWKSNQLLDVPGMNPATALTFTLAAEHLKPLLPKSVWDLMNPYFEHAGQVLDDLEWNSVEQWRHKIRVLPKGQPLLSPAMREDIHEQVTHALMTHQRLHAIYRPTNRPPTAYKLNPLGLVVRGNVSYLVATDGERSDLRQFALHRFEKVRALDEESTEPSGFCLDEYIRSGEFDYPVQEKKIRLVAIFDRSAAYHLSETPLSNDQKIRDIDEDWVKLTATVSDTLELRRWLMGFGNQVEIVSPARLRKEFRETAECLMDTYRQD